MHKSYFLLLVATLFALPTAANAQSVTQADGTTTSPYVELDHGPTALWRGGDEVSITHSAETFLEAGGVSCAGPTGAVTYTTENSYWRLFDLTEFGIAEDVTVTDVDMGIAVTIQPELVELDTVSAINFWAVDGAFEIAKLTPLGSIEFAIDETLGGDPQVVNIPVDGVTIPGGSTFAYEWNVPTGNSESTGFAGDFQLRYGQNAEGQTGPTYISTPDGCGAGITEPTDLATLNPDFASSHWVLVINGVTGAGTSSEDGAVAQRITIGQNYPNPVVGRTTVPFSLEAAQQVRVSVYDALGREVIIAADEAFGAGEQSVEVDVAGLPSGIYVYRVVTAEQTFARKMVVLQ